MIIKPCSYNAVILHRLRLQEGYKKLEATSVSLALLDNSYAILMPTGAGCTEQAFLP
jgi:hypothetical protein